MSDGLDGVVAAATVLSHSDAACGRLWVRGRPLEELAGRLGYEGMAALLWQGLAGEADGAAHIGAADIGAALGEGRRRAFEGLEGWLEPAALRPPAEAMRLCLAALPENATPAEIAGAAAVGAAAIIRRAQGLPPARPNERLTTAADFLAMMTGAPAADAAARALDIYFTVAAENGLGTSTFAARVVASTGASLAGAVLGAYCAFAGPLHGGAPGPVLAMLDEAAQSGDVERWLEQRLASGHRLFGFGNRAFPHGDPRAAILADALRNFTGDTPRLRFAADFQRQALAALARHRPGRALQPNLELNAALLLDACGIAQASFTPVFAMARILGWIAHALEQKQTGRMIRPTARYIGPPLA